MRVYMLTLVVFLFFIFSLLVLIVIAIVQILVLGGQVGSVRVLSVASHERVRVLVGGRRLAVHLLLRQVQAFAKDCICHGSRRPPSAVRNLLQMRTIRDDLP